MPRLLRRDTIRLLKAARSCLELALSALAFGHDNSGDDESPALAPTIGLIGISAELAASACLVQAHGAEFLLLPNRRYKSGREILDAFRELVRSGQPCQGYLAPVESEWAARSQSLFEKSGPLKRLVLARASALHAGKGMVRDVCIELAADASSLLTVLTQSSRIRPYLLPLPTVPAPRIARNVLVDELAQRARQTRNPGAIVGLYLLLPDVPEEEPNWLDALERVSVTPTQDDLDLLIQHMGTAVPVSLTRVTGSGPGLPMVYSATDPNAIAVNPHEVRHAITDLKEQWLSSSATAVGRSAVERLEVPPRALLLDIFAAVCRGVLVLEPGDLTVQRIWPSLVSAAAEAGTVGPYWFILTQCGDRSQLRGELARALQFGTDSVQTRAAEILKALGRGASSRDTAETELDYLARLAEDARKVRLARIDLARKLGGTYPLVPGVLLSAVTDVANHPDSSASVSTALSLLLDRDCGVATSARVYWAKALTECADSPNDVPHIVRLIKNSDFEAARTEARKAVRRIDFKAYGPLCGPPTSAGA